MAASQQKMEVQKHYRKENTKKYGEKRCKKKLRTYGVIPFFLLFLIIIYKDNVNNGWMPVVAPARPSARITALGGKQAGTTH